VDQKHASIRTGIKFPSYIVCKPVLVPNIDSKGNIISIDVKQPKTFAEQMLNIQKL
jgi:dipeptidyl-peptidase-3